MNNGCLFNAHAFEQATTELLIDICWEISGYQTLADSKRPPQVAEFRRTPSQSDEDWQKLIAWQVQLALHRLPPKGESDGLLALARKTERDAGLDQALQSVFAAVLLKPEAVYRFELGSGKPDEFGRIFLAPYELKYAIAYALTDAAPGKTVEKVAAHRRDLLPDYGFPSDWKWQEQQPIRPAVGRRSGMLTHPAWLLAFSDNEKNRAIQRGRWVQMTLQGGTVPNTPIGVDAKLPTDSHLTLREKMGQVTTTRYCWNCHQRMDPPGLPLEQFDDFGRWREEELDRPVNSTDNIAVGLAELDGPVPASELL